MWKEIDERMIYLLWMAIGCLMLSHSILDDSAAGSLLANIWAVIFFYMANHRYEKLKRRIDKLERRG